MVQRQQDGRGTSKEINSKEQDNIRRAKKAKQRANAGKSQQSGSFYDELLRERQQEARERREAREAKQQADQWQFRCDQSLEAKNHEWMLQLKPGTAAHKVAHQVLSEFPLAEPRATEDGEKISRTKVAVELAIASLSDKEVCMESAVRHGIRVAQTALTWAYTQLTKPAQVDIAS